MICVKSRREVLLCIFMWRQASVVIVKYKATTDLDPPQLRVFRNSSVIHHSMLTARRIQVHLASVRNTAIDWWTLVTGSTSLIMLIGLRIGIKRGVMLVAKRLGLGQGPARRLTSVNIRQVKVLLEQ